jgi:hypothetical protein
MSQRRPTLSVPFLPRPIQSSKLLIDCFFGSAAWVDFQQSVTTTGNQVGGTRKKKTHTAVNFINVDTFPLPSSSSFFFFFSLSCSSSCGWRAGSGKRRWSVPASLPGRLACFACLERTPTSLCACSQCWPREEMKRELNYLNQF